MNQAAKIRSANLKREKQRRELQSKTQRLARRKMLLEPLEDRGMMATFNVTASVADGAAGSLRAAITAANSNNENDTINLAAGSYVLTQSLSLSEAGKSISLIGEGSGSTIVDANHTGRVFSVSSGVTASFDGLKITNGGPISGGTSLTGAGISGSGATISVTNSIVSGNRGSSGGGVYVSGGALSLSGSTIEDNTSTSRGAGIYAQNATLSVSGSTIEDNANSGTQGGGVYALNTTTTLASTIISTNSVVSSGGGIFTSGGSLSVSGTVLNGNTGRTGAGLYLESPGSGVTISSTKITNNVGAQYGYGGGIYATGGSQSLSIVESTISGNTAAGNVGGVYSGLNLTINRSTISGNSTAGEAGGLYALGSLTLTNSTVSGNSSTGYGGGLIYMGNSAAFANVTFVNNTSSSLGGGMYLGSGKTISLLNTILANNTGTGTYPDVSGSSGSLVSQGYNLFSSSTISALITGTTTGNQLGANPQLGSLANNGGPTYTHALASNSPAIDAGTSSGAPSVDQRNQSRPSDGNSSGTAEYDIGAYEFIVAPPAPVAIADSYTNAVEDANLEISANGVLANDTPNPVTLTAILVTSPTHGKVTLNSSGSFLYTPDADYHGNDSFTYKVNDGSVNSDPSTVSITVASVNDLPVGQSDTYELNEDSCLNLFTGGILENDTDADKDSLSAVLISTVKHGELKLNANGTFNYVPDDNYFGADTFTYQASDGTGKSETTTVTLQVLPVEDDPFATADIYSLSEDGNLAVEVEDGVLENDFDPDPDTTLAASVVSDVSHGSLTLNANGSFEYTPDADFAGDDSFTYQVSDGSNTSNIVSVTITVSPVNDAPVAIDDSGNTTDDTPLTGEVPTPITGEVPGLLANDTDVDENSLAVIEFDAVSQYGATVTVNSDGSFSYDPSVSLVLLALEVGDTLEDTFYYTISDGEGETSEGKVTITVTGKNQAPVAVNDSRGLQEDENYSVSIGSGLLINDSDAEGSALTAQLVDEPSHGNLAFHADGTFSYTPDKHYYGKDSFSYKVSDGELYSNTAAVSLTIASVNFNPDLTEDKYTTAEDNSLTVTAKTGVLSNDTDKDGDTLTAKVLTEPNHGQVALSADGSFKYTPAQNYNGPDSFTYEVVDGEGGYGSATVSLTITAVNDAPVAVPQSKTVTRNQPQSIPVNGSDVEGAALTYQLVTSPAHGTLTGSFPDLTYTSGGSYLGADSFEFRVTDGALYSNTAKVTLNIVPAPPPVANAQSLSTLDDTNLPITLTGSSPGGGTLAYFISGQSAHGVLTGTAPNLTYRADVGFDGTDTFTFYTHDGTTASSLATISIAVTAQNQTPVAQSLEYVVPGGIESELTLEASDFENDELTFEILTQPSHGILTGTAPDLVFTPTTGYAGSDSFTYRVSDGEDYSNTATVTIDIEAVEEIEVGVSEAIVNVRLLNDDGVSPSDRITSDLHLVGSVTNLLPGARSRVEFDHRGDGTAEGQTTNAIAGAQFIYDPVTFESALATFNGQLDLHYRVIEVNDAGQTIAIGEWQGLLITGRHNDVDPEIAVLTPEGALLSDGVGEVDFGKTMETLPLRRSIVLRNDGGGTLNISSITLPAGFSLVTTPGTTLAGEGSSFELVIQLDATDSGSYSGSLTINSNDADEDTYQIQIEGIVVEPAPEIDVRFAGAPLTSGQGKVDFGLVESGIVAHRTLVITNVGLLPLTIDTAATMLPAGFALVSLSEDELDAGESAEMIVELDSTTPGPHEGTFQFTTNDGDEGTFVVRVRGFIGTEADWEAPEVDDLYLVNDTDTAADLITSDPRVAGVIISAAGMTDFSGVKLRYDLNGDGKSDGLATVDAEGEFVLDLRQTGLAAGTIPLRFKVGRHVEYLGTSVYSEWAPFTFEYQPAEPELTITDLALVQDTGTPADGVTSDVRIVGTARRGGEILPFAQVEVDLNGDNLVDLTINSSLLGRFKFNPAEFSELTAGPLGARLRGKSVGVYESAIVSGNWQTLPFTYEPYVRPAPVLTNLIVSQLPGLGADFQDEVRLSGTVTTTADPNAYLQVEFDLNADGVPDGSIGAADEQGNFQISILASEFATGANSVRVRGVERLVSSSSGDLAGEWETVSFNLAEADVGELSIEDLYLVRDTGTTGDLITADLRIGGVLDWTNGPITTAIIEYDLNGDEVAEGNVGLLPGTNGEFRFSLNSLHLPAGQITVSARALFLGSGEVAPPSEWVALSFEYDPEAWTIPTIAGLSVVGATMGSNGLVTSDPTVIGTLSGELLPHQTAFIEFDRTGDFVSDGSVPLDGTTGTEFAIALSRVGQVLGPVQLRARVVVWDAESGVRRISDWSSVSFEYAAATAATPSIDNDVHLINDTGAADNSTSDPRIEGTVLVSAGSANNLAVQYDLNNDDNPEGFVNSAGTGDAVFSIDLGPHLSVSGQVTARIRAVTRDSAGVLVYGGWEIFEFNYEKPEGLVAPTVRDLHLTRDTGELGDGVTSEPVVRGFVSTPVGDLYAVPVEYDLNGDGNPEGVILADVNGNGEFELDLRNAGVALGEGEVSFRAVVISPTDGSQLPGDWNTLEFDYEMDAIGEGPQSLYAPTQTVPASTLGVPGSIGFIPNAARILTTSSNIISRYELVDMIAGGRFTGFNNRFVNRGESFTETITTDNAPETRSDGALIEKSIISTLTIDTDLLGDGSWTVSETLVSSYLITTTYSGSDREYVLTQWGSHNYEFLASGSTATMTSSYELDENWSDYFTYVGTETTSSTDYYNNYCVTTNEDNYEGSQSFTFVADGSSYYDSNNVFLTNEEQSYHDESAQTFARHSENTVTPLNGYAFNMTTDIHNERFSNTTIGVTVDSGATTPLTRYELDHDNEYNNETKVQYNNKSMYVTESSSAAIDETRFDVYTDSARRSLVETVDTLLNTSSNQWEDSDRESKYDWNDEKSRHANYQINNDHTSWGTYNNVATQTHNLQVEDTDWTKLDRTHVSGETVIPASGSGGSNVFSTQTLSTNIGTSYLESRNEKTEVSNYSGGGFNRVNSLDSDIYDRSWNVSESRIEPDMQNPVVTKIEIRSEKFDEHDEEKNVMGGPGYEATRLEVSDESTITNTRREIVNGTNQDSNGQTVAQWGSDSLVESQDLTWQHKQDYSGSGSQRSNNGTTQNSTSYGFSESSGAQGYGSQKSEVNELWSNNVSYGYGGVESDGEGRTVVVVNGTKVATNTDTRSASFNQINNWNSKFESSGKSTSRSLNGVVTKFEGNEKSTDSGVGSSSGQMFVTVANNDESTTKGMFSSNSQYAGNFTWNFDRETSTAGAYDAEPRVRHIIDAESSYSENGSGTYSGTSVGMGTMVGLTELVDVTVDQKTDSSSTYQSDSSSSFATIDEKTLGTRSTSNTQASSSDDGSTTFKNTFNSKEKWVNGLQTIDSTDTTVSKTSGEISEKSSDQSTSKGVSKASDIVTEFDNGASSAATKDGTYSSESKTTVEIASVNGSVLKVTSVESDESAEGTTTSKAASHSSSKTTDKSSIGQTRVESLTSKSSAESTGDYEETGKLSTVTENLTEVSHYEKSTYSANEEGTRAAETSTSSKLDKVTSDQNGYSTLHVTLTRKSTDDAKFKTSESGYSELDNGNSTKVDQTHEEEDGDFTVLTGEKTKSSTANYYLNGENSSSTTTENTTYSNRDGKGDYSSSSDTFKQSGAVSIDEEKHESSRNEEGEISYGDTHWSEDYSFREDTDYLGQHISNTTTTGENKAKNDKRGDYKSAESSKSYKLNGYYSNDSAESYEESGDASFSTESWSEARTNPPEFVEESLGLFLDPPELEEGEGDESFSFSNDFKTVYSRTTSAGSGPYEQKVSDKTHNESNQPLDQWHDEESKESVEGTTSAESRQTGSLLSVTYATSLGSDDLTVIYRLDTSTQRRNGDFKSSAESSEHRHNLERVSSEVNEYEEDGTTSTHSFSKYKNTRNTQEYATEDYIPTIGGNLPAVWSKGDHLVDKTSRDEGETERSSSGIYHSESSELKTYSNIEGIDEKHLTASKETSSDNGTTSETTDTEAAISGKRMLNNPYYATFESDTSSGSSRRGTFKGSSEEIDTASNITENSVLTKDVHSYSEEKYSENGTAGYREKTESNDKQTYRSPDEHVYDRINDSQTYRTGSGPYSEEFNSWSSQDNDKVASYRFEESKAKGTATWGDINSSEIGLTGHVGSKDTPQYKQPLNGPTFTEITKNNVTGVDTYDSTETSNQVDSDTTNREESNFKTRANVSEYSKKTTSNVKAMQDVKGSPGVQQGYTVTGSEISTLNGVYIETTKSVVEEKSNGGKSTFNSRTFDENGTTTWNDVKDRTETRIDNSNSAETVTLKATNAETDKGSGTYNKHEFTQSEFTKESYNDNGKWKQAGDSFDKMTSNGLTRNSNVKSETSSHSEVIPTSDGTETRTASQTRGIDDYTSTEYEGKKNKYTETAENGEVTDWGDSFGRREQATGRVSVKGSEQKSKTVYENDNWDGHFTDQLIKENHRDAGTSVETTYDRSKDNQGEVTEKKTSLRWEFDVRTQIIQQTYEGEEHHHPEDENYTSSNKYNHTTRTTERSEKRRADSLAELALPIVEFLTPIDLQTLGLPPQTEPIYIVEARKSSLLTENLDHTEYDSGDQWGNSEATEHVITRTFHEAAQQSKTTIPPSSKEMLPLQEFLGATTERKYKITDGYSLSRVHDSYGEAYGISDTRHSENEEKYLTVKEITWDQNNQASGKQTDTRIEEGKSNYETTGDGWSSSGDQTWSTHFEQVFQPTSSGGYQLLSFDEVTHHASNSHSSETGKSATGHSTYDSREALSGAYIVQTSDVHSWGTWTAGGVTNSYDDAYHLTYSYAATPRPGMVEMINSGAYDVSLDTSSPFNLITDRLESFAVSISWSFTTDGLDWVDPYQAPPTTTYTGPFDWFGQNVILPWVGVERLANGGRFGTGLLDDLMVAGLLATEIVGYLDPTPISDVLNAGLNAADGNYVDAGIGLASALVPGGAAAAGRVTGRAVNNVGSKLANGLGNAARGISRHTACDAPTAGGRVVGNLLGRCFVYDTELVYDRLPEEASTNSGLAFSLLRLEFVAAAAVVVVSGTLLEVSRRKAKREAEQEFEQLLDQLFDSGEWNEADSEETQISSAEESVGFEDVPHISDDFLPRDREGDYDANMRWESKNFAADDAPAERHERASATATVTAVGTARRVQRPSHKPQVKTTKSRWSIIVLWTVLLFGLGFGGHSLLGMLTSSPSEVAVTQGTGRRFVTQPIGAARPGEWILAKNPRGAEDEDVEITDPSAWRLVKLSIADSFGWQVEIETLQQAAVLEEAAAEVGSLIEVELLELEAEGEATVVSIDPCPDIKPSPSAEHHLIVSKFRRRARNVIQVNVVGNDKPIGVTANHPFWSADRLDFIEAAQLRAGENATDPDGRLIQIASLDLTPRNADVFNIEVAAEHVYHVGDLGIIVHNSCSKFANTNKAPTIIYEVFEKQTGKAVYVGQVLEGKGVARRFTEHLGPTSTKGWSRATHDIRPVNQGNWTPFEAHVRELIQVNKHGLDNLQNIVRPISQAKFNKYKNLHNFLEEVF